jgi:hypothetical protein
MEVASLVFEILGFAATVGLTVGIFWFERKQSKQKDKRDIARIARQFIYDNLDDMSFLCLCEVAASVNPMEKHRREIYNKYNALPREIQLEVLAQKKVSLRMPEDKSWVDEYLEKWKKDAIRYKLCSEDHCFLYEGAKYFHRAFRDYRNSLFKLKTYYRSEYLELGKINVDIGRYTMYWLERETFEDNLPKNALPPIDYSNMQNDEEMFVQDMMEIISYLSDFIYNQKSEIHNINIFNETYCEDKYYSTLFSLYFAYC